MKKFYIFLLGILVLSGIFVRVFLYLKAVPFWHDEMMLGLSFFNSNLLDMFHELDAHQKCPPLFCFFVFIVLKLFGYSLYSFRLIPLISSIFSVFLFTGISLKLYKTKIAVLLSVFIFSFSVPLIYYSQEFKPYSTDVFLCLLLIFIYDYIHFKNMSNKKVFLYSIAAFLISITSFPALLIIPAIVLTKFIEEKCITKKAFFILFGYILGVLYLFLLYKNYYAFETLENEWQTGFFKFSLSSVHCILSNFFNFFIYQYNDSYYYIILVLLIFGFVLLLKFNSKKGILITFIISFLVIASYFKFYSMTNRLILFMIPITILLVANTLDCPIKLSYKNLCKVTPPHNKKTDELLGSKCDTSLVNKIFFHIKTVVLLVIIFIAFNLQYIPYINIPEKNLILRNYLSERETKLKAMDNVLKNIKNNAKVLTIDEMEICIRFYNEFLKYNKKFSFSLIDIIFDTESETQKKLDNFLNLSISDKNDKSILILIRSIEYWDSNTKKRRLYFFEDQVKNTLKKRKLKYIYNKNDDIYWYLVK